MLLPFARLASPCGLGSSAGRLTPVRTGPSISTTPSNGLAPPCVASTRFSEDPPPVVCAVRARSSHLWARVKQVRELSCERMADELGKYASTSVRTSLRSQPRPPRATSTRFAIDPWAGPKLPPVGSGVEVRTCTRAELRTNR